MTVSDAAQTSASPLPASALQHYRGL